MENDAAIKQKGSVCREIAKIATVVLLCACPWQRDSAATLFKGGGEAIPITASIENS